MAAAFTSVALHHSHDQVSKAKELQVFVNGNTMPSGGEVLRECAEVSRQSQSAMGSVWAKRRMTLTASHLAFGKVGTDIQVVPLSAAFPRAAVGATAPELQSSDCYATTKLRHSSANRSGCWPSTISPRLRSLRGQT
jgi:hypothetical protein